MDLIQVLATDWCMTTEITTVQNLISTVILIIQIAVPILLVIFGMLDLGKAVVASKEDEIKKGQQLFIKRLITAALVFLVIFIVKILISIIAPDAGIWECADRFLNGVETSTRTGNQ